MMHTEAFQSVQPVRWSLAAVIWSYFRNEMFHGRPFDCTMPAFYGLHMVSLMFVYATIQMFLYIRWLVCVSIHFSIFVLMIPIA